MKKRSRSPRLHGLYQQYLLDQDTEAFSAQVCAHYNVGTLERLAGTGERMARRAAVLCLGLVADYGANATLGRAMIDSDRGVRMLAENGIRQLWCRSGDSSHRHQLARVIELNATQRFDEAIASISPLIEKSPQLAEGWNQRAIAMFNIGRYAESIRDCHQALELNPYHFGAATGMGQCHLQLNDRASALECFRRALRLNPNLEAVRAHILYLQRTLNSQE